MELTNTEQNFLKDILKFFGEVDDEFLGQVVQGLGMTLDEFDELADSCFTKLQNGRVTTN